ncbi:MAG: hypothetical protein RMK19_00500 [Bacteroidia bacterium]|nr:hypothetical protein [Bacteroidia bacterium]MDW8014477.1 hypothetical protein [Bacteroidia bacterium]
MAYTPEEYNQLKEFYKKELRERRELLEQFRLRHLSERAQWHLHQIQVSLAQLGVSSEPSPSSEEPSPPVANKTLL